MNYEWVENVGNLPDKSIITIINAIQRRLDKNIDKDEIQKLMSVEQEVLLMEAEKRGLEV